MIDYLDPEQHGEMGNPMAFWLRLDEVVDRPREMAIKRTLGAAMGPGSSLPPPRDHAGWGHKFVDGRLVLMFYTAEDRDIARLLL